MKQLGPKHPADENPGKTGKICVLINSIFYFIGCAFIMKNEDNYRLIVRHDGKLLVNKSYKTPRGAKIAFTKLFDNRGWTKEMKADWSIFYEPDAIWLKEREGN